MKHFNLFKRLLLMPLLVIAAYSSALAQPLNGTYTIGGTTPNYPDMAAAVAALNTNGISGDVIFNIRLGTYTTNNQVTINNFTNAGGNRVTFQSETGSKADVSLSANGTSTNNFVIRLNGASNVTFRNLTIINPNTSFGRVIEFVGAASRDSIYNCDLSGGVTTTSSENLAVIFANALTGTNNVIHNNVIWNGSYGISFKGTSATTTTSGHVISNNQIGTSYNFGINIAFATNTSVRNNTINKTGAGIFVGLRSESCGTGFEFLENIITGATWSTASSTGIQVVTGNGMTVNRNTINVASSSVAINGIHALTTTQNCRIINNNVRLNDGTGGTATGIWDATGTNNQYINNVVYVRNTTATSYALHVGSSINCKFYNNTLQIRDGGNNAAAIQITTAGANDTFRNNFIAAIGGNGIPVIRSNANAISTDYNCYIGISGLALMRITTPLTLYTSIPNLRAATPSMERNSLSILPALAPYIDPMTNLEPNPSVNTCWFLNGRGIHIPGNNTDINGNPRAVLRTQGVPDIGAYEFLPTVDPPNCDVIYDGTAPLAAAPGVMTYAMGGDTVITLRFNPTDNVPAILDVKQWTGTLPPAINPTFATNMYYYVDVVAGPPGPPVPYAYTSELYYKEAWMNTVTSERGLLLAKFDIPPSTTWDGINKESFSDEGRNILYTNTDPDMTTFGYMTPVDVSDNASMIEFVEPNVKFCASTKTIKVKIRNDGNNNINFVRINWEVDGVSQPPVIYNATQLKLTPPDNEAIVTLGNVSFFNTAHRVKAWVLLPNGRPDVLNKFDTLQKTFRDGLIGTYTVGGTNPDYIDVDSAVADLDSFGMCGPVTFNIRDGNYDGGVVIASPAIQRLGSATDRLTFQAENGLASGVNITYRPDGATDNYVVKVNNFSHLTLRNLTFTALPTDDIVPSHAFGNCVDLTASSNDTLTGCVFNATSFNSADPVTLVSCVAFRGACSKNIITNNVFNRGSAGIMLFSSAAVPAPIINTDYLIANNTLGQQITRGIYVFGATRLSILNNTLTDVGQITTDVGGIVCNYANDSLLIINNRINMSNSGAGIRLFDCVGTAAKRGLIKNNTVVIGGSNPTALGITLIGTTAYQQVQNNSVNIMNTQTNLNVAAAAFSATGGNNEIFNNALCNTGGGFALLLANTIPASTLSDYNNIYTTGPKLVALANNTQYDNLAQYRAIAGGRDRNSISYDPGYMTFSNLQPDPAKPASWSLNGRGVHIVGNNVDINGNPRVETRDLGVPDIGAYEFTPTSIPPLATATPAVPVPGGIQTYTFGWDTVATVKWDPIVAVPSSIEVRQYSGVKPPQFPAANNFMYFYTDINTPAATYGYDMSVFYDDTWLGTIPVEGALRLGRQSTAGQPWIAYNEGASSVDVLRNRLSASSLTGFGRFTGLEDGSILSAINTPGGPTVFCTGGSVLLKANTTAANDYLYQWKLNGTNIPNATAPTFTATIAGAYSVQITRTTTSQMVESEPVQVTIVSPPSAVITPNGPALVCSGNTLKLDANTGSGLTYQWQQNGTDIAGATGTSYGVTEGGSYTVRVKNIGCSNTSLPFIVNQGPANVYLGADTTFCESKILTLDAGNPGARYVWSTGDTTQKIEVYGMSGTYWVEVNAGSSCIAKDTIEVHVDPLPVIRGINYIRANNGNGYFFEPGATQNVESLLWVFGDGKTDTTRKIYRDYPGGQIDVMLIVFNGCGSDTAKLRLPEVGIANQERNNTIKLYPNPAQDVVIIKADGKLLSGDMMIVNSVGVQVYRDNNNEAVQERRISVGNLPNGHYILRARSTDGQVINMPFDILR
jgi:hypothetical protein